jgi:hypothetical protein
MREKRSIAHMASAVNAVLPAVTTNTTAAFTLVLRRGARYRTGEDRFACS